jgi:predicted RNase H-like HicB family nuclease
MSQYSFSVIIWREDEVYVSKCPEIEVASTGDTPEEALNNLKEAIELWIENAKELGILEDHLPALTTKTRFTSNIEIEV